MSEPDFTQNVTIKGDEWQYDPALKIARIACENCGHYNDVDVDMENGQPQFMGFVCEKCGHWNAPA